MATAAGLGCLKLLIDEMWPAAIAVQLRTRQYDVIAVQERTDLSGHDDETVFVAAQAEQRAIFTENVSDYRLLAIEHLRQGRSHCGLVFSSNRSLPRHSPRTVGRIVIALVHMLAERKTLLNEEYWLR